MKKEFVLEEQPYLLVGGMKAYRMRDPETGRGIMHMKIADTVVRVCTDDDKQIGELTMCVGGAIELAMGEESFTICPMELWELFQKGFEAGLQPGVKKEKK